MNTLENRLKIANKEGPFVDADDRLNQAALSGAIEVNNLSFKYGNNTSKVIDDLDLQIASCESVALLGPSGCGKSTLLHLISGLIKPTSGQMILDGNQITKPTPKCNLMLQQATLYPWLTVFQNAAFGLNIQGLSKTDTEKIVNPILRMVKLHNLANRNVRQLSGGQ